MVKVQGNRDPSGHAWVLRNRAHVPKRQDKAVWALHGLLFGTAVFGPVLILRDASDGRFSWEQALELYRSVVEGWLDDPWQLAQLILYVAAFIAWIAYAQLARRRERVILTRESIRYDSPLRGVLQRVRPSWEVRWRDLAEIHLRVAQYTVRPEFVQLVLKAADGSERTLVPYAWVDPKRMALERGPRLSLMPPSEDDVLQTLRNTAIVRFIRSEVSSITFGEPLKLIKQPPGYAIEKNPVSLSFAAAFFALFAYVMLDTFVFNTERYAAGPSWETYAGAGAVVAAFAALIMYRARVPLAESITVGVLVGGVFACALYPGLLRINRLTDREGLQPHEYVSVDIGHYVPVEPGPPELIFTEQPGYWAQFPVGSHYTFWIRRGGLGFYQFDYAPIREQYREFCRDG